MNELLSVSIIYQYLIISIIGGYTGMLGLFLVKESKLKALVTMTLTNVVRTIF